MCKTANAEISKYNVYQLQTGLTSVAACSFKSNSNQGKDHTLMKVTVNNWL